MMKNASFLLLLSISSFLQTRCTVAGFAIGASQDARQPKQEKTITSQEIAGLKKNTRITVYRAGHEPITGIYRGNINVRLSKDVTVPGIILEKKGAQFEQHQIPLEQIEKVYVPARTAKGKLIGLAVGFGVDLGIILISLASFSFDFF